MIPYSIQLLIGFIVVFTQSVRPDVPDGKGAADTEALGVEVGPKSAFIALSATQSSSEQDKAANNSNSDQEKQVSGQEDPAAAAAADPAAAAAPAAPATAEKKVWDIDSRPPDSQFVMEKDYGDTNCPCLTYEQLRKRLPSTDDPQIGPYTMWQPEKVKYDRQKGKNVQLSNVFGGHCNSWDMPNTNFGVPIWLNQEICPKLDDKGNPSYEYAPSCYDYFCYVDPCKCDKADVSQTAQFSHQYKTAEKLAHSYATCARCHARKDEKQCKQHTTCKFADGKCQNSDEVAKSNANASQGISHDYIAKTCAHLTDEGACNGKVSCTFKDGKCVPQAREVINAFWDCGSGARPMYGSVLVALTAGYMFRFILVLLTSPA